MPGGGCVHWCFTSFKSKIEFENGVDKSAIVYLVYGVEKCPTTEKTHLQGYCAFKNRATLSRAKSLLGDPAAHFEKKRGTVQQASDYCKKDGDYEEYGTLPQEQTERATLTNKRMWEEARDLAEAGKIEQIHPELQIKYIRNFERIEERARTRRVLSELLPGSICGLFLQGGPGVGKTFFARQYCRERGLTFFVKPPNKWWDGYQDEKVIILEDVDHFNAKHLGHNIKLWADEAPFMAEVKGGSSKIRPLLLIITSNYPINELWANDTVLQEAIKRRFFAPVITSREDFGGIVWPENFSILRNGSQKEIPIASSPVSESTA